MDQYWTGHKLFSDGSCGDVDFTPSDGNLLVEGRVKMHQDPNAVVRYWAAAPMDRMTTFAGSGLPFANAEMAYENTPNRGAVRAVNGKFSFKIFKPNSFYIKGGVELLPPHVLINVCSGNNTEIEGIILSKPLRDRSLTWLPDHYTRSSYKSREWDTKDLRRFDWAV